MTLFRDLFANHYFKERGKEGGREEGREGGKEGRREGGRREGGREGERERGREGEWREAGRQGEERGLCRLGEKDILKIPHYIKYVKSSFLKLLSFVYSLFAHEIMQIYTEVSSRFRFVENSQFLFVLCVLLKNNQMTLLQPPL